MIDAAHPDSIPEAGPVLMRAQPAGGVGDPDGRQRRTIDSQDECREQSRRELQILLISRLACTQNLLADSQGGR